MLPKELFIMDTAGLDGYGASSYIDSVIRRDADESDWLGETTGLDDTLYYLQNWRADVVVTVRPAVESGDPVLVDQVRYSAYGVPWAYSLADMVPIGGTGSSPYSPDGEITYDDQSAYVDWYNGDDLSADIVSNGGTAEFPSPPDGQLTVDDILTFVNAYGNDGSGATGRAVLSRTHSRRGYAGYEYDPGLMTTSYLLANGAARAMWHVRHRVLDSETGRWTRRDPLGYVDGMGLYEYCSSQSITDYDAEGLCGDGSSLSIGSGIEPRPMCLPPPPMLTCVVTLYCKPVALGLDDHCGLVVDTGLGIYRFDGSGGEINWWKPSIISPSPIPLRSPVPTKIRRQRGTQLTFPVSACACLFNQCFVWNTNQWPRDNFVNNSNWNLKCQLKKCGLSRLAPSGNRPIGWDRSFKSRCIRWERLRSAPDARTCVQYENQECPGDAWLPGPLDPRINEDNHDGFGPRDDRMM